MSEKNLGLLLVAPAVLIIALVAFYPIINALYLSLFSFNLKFAAQGREFIGLGNFIEMVADDRFIRATANTFYFTGVSVALELILGFLMALLMTKAFSGRGLVRAAVLVPWAIPTVVSAMMWRFIYNDRIGLLNGLLGLFRLESLQRVWLGNPATALGAMIFTDVWKTSPYMALLLLAGLQVIPEELYEAASIDGASKWQQFWTITLPLVKPAMLVALLFRTMDAFRIFDLVFVMTGGGPGNSTETLSVYAYKVLFRYLDFGYGSALSVMVFFFVLLISFFYVKVLGARRD